MIQAVLTVFADVGRFCKKETLFSSFKLELRSRIDLIRSIGSFMKLISTTACDLKKVLHTSTYLGFFNSRLFSATSLDHVLLHQDGHIHETTYLQEPDSVFSHDRIPIVSENKVRFIYTPKLYIPSTLNIVLLQWHTHLNVCAVK